jgi:hypothetical protein
MKVLLEIVIAVVVTRFLLKKVEKAADDDRLGPFSLVAKIVCVVLVFFLEFFLTDMVPELAKDAAQQENPLPNTVPYTTDP